jgi:hypothetical protein
MRFGTQHVAVQGYKHYVASGISPWLRAAVLELGEEMMLPWRLHHLAEACSHLGRDGAFLLATVDVALHLLVANCSTSISVEARSAPNPTSRVRDEVEMTMIIKRSGYKQQMVGQGDLMCCRRKP